MNRPVFHILFGTDDFNLQVIRTGETEQPAAGGGIPAVICEQLFSVPFRVSPCSFFPCTAIK